MTDDQVLLADRYKLSDRLGRGGMAEVRRGFDVRLNRTVAVKSLKVELAADPSFQERFRREAHAAASLNHPGIAAIYDTGQQTDESTGVPVPFLVMELVDGPTLRDVLREEGPLPAERALELTRVVLGALGHSHAAGIVHRDIKPSNIMLTPNGDAKVMDFGIARAASETSSSLTATATVLGTAHYLSPEQARGERVDQRSDLYSTGCLLYELLLGRPPFVGDSSVSVAYQHVRESPAPPSSIDPSLGPDIDAVVARSLAKDPADRYQSAEDMAADISRVLAGRPTHAAMPSEHTQDTHVLPATMRSPVNGADDEATHGLRGPVVPAADPAPTASTAVVAAADQPTESRRAPAGRTVLVALLTVLVLAGLGFGAYWVLAGGPSNNVTVPSLVGSTRPEAEEKLQAVGLQPAFRHVVGPDDDTVDTVIRQGPEPEVEVAPGSRVTAEINVGPATEEIPEDLLGQDLDEVVEELTKAGFTNVTSVQVAAPPAGADADEVVGVDPAEGEKAALEQDITVSYVGRAAPNPTTGSRAEPGASSSSRPSEAESSDEPEEDESSAADEPSEDPTSEEPSAEPSESSEPEPSESESSEPETSESPSGGGGPSAEVSESPAGEESEAPPVSVDPADASLPGGGLGG